MFLLSFSTAPRWALACPWGSGSAARSALGLKTSSTPLNCDNRAYSIQYLFAERGRNTFMENGTGPSSFGEFLCFRLGSRSGHNGQRIEYQSLTRIPRDAIPQSLVRPDLHRRAYCASSSARPRVRAKEPHEI